MARRKSTTKVQRANGMGSVYKHKKDLRRPYQARITKPPELIKGKIVHKRLSLGYFETEEEAQEVIRLYCGSPIPEKHNITLEQLYKEWSAAHYSQVKQSSKESYQSAWKYLSKYYNMPFKELRTAHLQSLVNIHALDKSRSTVQKIKVLAGLLYKYAMQNDIVNKNYAEFVKLPKEDKIEKEIFTDFEIAAIEKSADHVPYLDTVLILIYTGLRISELLDLTPFNIHLDDGYMVAGGKTEAGTNRIIPIHPKIEKYIEKRLRSGNSHLIASPSGQKLNSKNYRKRYYYTALEAIGVAQKTPHTCRHTYATLLSNKGADTKSIQAILGHTRYSFTADTYTHKDINELKKAAFKL